MQKQDAVPPFFVDGPSVEHDETLRRWIDARTAAHPGALLRLPFTFRAGTTNRAALGLPGGADEGWLHRLDDAALSISLADRLRPREQPSPERFAIWLSVRLRARQGAELPVASILAVHERIAPDVPAKDLRAQAERGADCLAVRQLGQGHCARGPQRCERCKEAASKPASIALLDLCPDDAQAARPTIAVERRGETTYMPFDVLRRFASADEAKAFAARHQLVDVRVDAAEP